MMLMLGVKMDKDIWVQLLVNGHHAVKIIFKVIITIWYLKENGVCQVSNRKIFLVLQIIFLLHTWHFEDKQKKVTKVKTFFFQLILVHVETYSVGTVVSIAMISALDGKLLATAQNIMWTLCLTIARKPVDVEVKYGIQPVEFQLLF